MTIFEDIKERIDSLWAKIDELQAGLDQVKGERDRERGKTKALEEIIIKLNEKTK